MISCIVIMLSSNKNWANKAPEPTPTAVTPPAKLALMGLHPAARREQIGATQNGSTHAGGRHGRMMQILQVPTQLPTTPSRIRVPNRGDRGRHLADGGVRRNLRATRVFYQRIYVASGEPYPPFIAGSGADAKSPAKLPEVDASCAGKKYKFVTLRHGCLGNQGHHPSVTHFSEQCYPSLQSIQTPSR